jgi:polygalacturonase
MGVLPFYLFTFLPLTATAQTAREEIRANKYLAGSNYLDYDRQLSTKKLTPAPKGYIPYYMSHYGRHGSRWLISKDSYTSVTEPMQKARKAGKLTAKGEEVLKLLEQFVAQPPANFPTLDGKWQGAQPRLGDLTTVGERQHHGIGRRMTQNFPEIFKAKNVPIDARSTTVNRCILSMIAECEELTAANPTARIHNDVSDALQYYLNQPRSGLVRAMSRKGYEAKQTVGKARIKPDRLMGVLFNDTEWVKKELKASSLMSSLFEITTNMQSHDTDIDLYDLFTEDEIYDQWRTRNIGWYLDYGAAPQTGCVMPFSQKNLLRNIIETADTVTQTQATLRFGHEVCVMPLACLLELDSCGASVSDLDQLDKVWRNYHIYPMGCNIQLIFYRPKKGQGDILVKALLNERECSMPVKTTQYPYYKWSELRQYYLDKLTKFEEQEAAANTGDDVDTKYIKYYMGLPVKMQQVKRPNIPDRTLSIKETGGVGDGVTLNTEAFSKAIAQLAAQGGGRLNVPQGVWLTGPIQLDNNIELHLDKNAIVYFTPDKQQYVDSKKRSNRVLPCIYADKKHDIAITGDGIIDGNGQQWRPVKRGKMSDVEWKLYHDMGGVDKDKGQLWYPWQMKSGYPDISDSPEKQERMRNDLVRLTDCKNLLFEGVTFQNAPKFHVHPCYCENVIIDGITVRCPWNAQNGDAIDLSDCHRALIVNCTVDAGDDGLCMKSGKPRKNSINGVEDVLIQDNTVYHAHGAFVLGSETAAGVRRVVVRNCRFSGTDTGLRFKSGIGRGGKTEQLYISNIVMSDIKDQAIVFQCDYVDRPAGSDPKAMPTFTDEQLQWTPHFQDIHIDKVVCRGTHTAIKASGIPNMDCVSGIDIKNSTFVYTNTDCDIDESTAKLTLKNVNFVADKKQ